MMRTLSQMLWPMAALVAIVLLAALAVAILRGRRSAESWPFLAKRVMTQPEQVLFFRLKEALPEHIVLAQVQLSRFLEVKRGHNVQAWLNRINRMSVDYAICHKDTTVATVVELDDKSHQSQRRREADAKKESALSAAGLKVVRFGVADLPDVARLRDALLPNLAFKRTPAGEAGRGGHPVGAAQRRR